MEDHDRRTLTEQKVVIGVRDINQHLADGWRIIVESLRVSHADSHLHSDMVVAVLERTG